MKLDKQHNEPEVSDFVKALARCLESRDKALEEKSKKVIEKVENESH